MSNQRLIVFGFLVLFLSLTLLQPVRAQPADIPAEKLSAIAAWLTSTFGMPPTSVMPDVVFTSRAELEQRRYGGVFRRAREAGAMASAAPGSQTHLPAHRDVVAIYDDATRTIYLSDRWRASSLADQSVLVHEMLHHMQTQAGMTYACGGAREKPAYLAQKKWLEDHGLDLEQEFEVDMFTIIAMSVCM